MKFFKSLVPPRIRQQQLRAAADEVRSAQLNDLVERLEIEAEMVSKRLRVLDGEQYDDGKQTD